MPSFTKGSAIWSICFASLIFACDQKEPSPPKSPEEELASFELADDLHIELVAAEPMVQDPVFFAFDHLNRLWIAEMSGFNATLDGEGENDPVGKIVVLTDEDGDGQMDTRNVFLDSLVLPRSFAFVRGGLLVAERIPLWFVEDTDGDLKADRKIMIDSAYGGRGHVEHSPNGLLWGIDNWIYNAKSTVRYKQQGDDWIKDTTEFRGQWGISHDNFGRLYYNYNWSQLHADLVPPNYFSRNPNHLATTGIDHGLTLSRSIHPIRATPAVNRGYIDGTLNSDQALLEFTSACSPLVYRGTALPLEMVGDVFVCEPAGNLIKRNRISNDGYMISASDAYEQRDFLASTDERFRPVFLANAPDGALYVADMYRGLIEHWKYMTLYLKEQTIKRKLEYPHHLGRIWRITQLESHQPSKMNDRSAQELISALSDDNGWRRDMAQRLLVQNAIPESKPLLLSLLQKSAKPLARLHALWTLEGMQVLDEKILLSTLNDAYPQVTIAAMRILDQQIRAGVYAENMLLSWISSNWKGQPEEVTLQMLLSLGNLSTDAVIPLMGTILQKYLQRPLMHDAVMSGLYNREIEMYGWLITQEKKSPKSQMQANFYEMLGSAIGKHAQPSVVSALLDLVASDAERWENIALLTGMLLQLNQNEEPIQLKKIPSLVRSTARLGEELKHKVVELSLLCEWPGHKVDRTQKRTQASLSSEEQLLFTIGRKHYLTTCSSCHGDDGRGLRRFAPPLKGSEWVLGDDRRLALVLLHGIEGPIEVNGHTYQAPEILPVMPAHSILNDREIAAIMTYIRNDWGNNGSAIKPGRVGHIRHRSQGRVQPWDVNDLTAHLEGLENQDL